MAKADPKAGSAQGMRPTLASYEGHLGLGHVTNKLPPRFTEVVPANKGYRHFFFAFTPECPRLEDGKPCQDNEFGVTNLSGKAGFIANGLVSDTNLSQQIIKCVGSVVSEFDASNYMQINYEAPEIQAAVMHANMPLARFIVHCPPCIGAITTAVNLCQANEDAITQWSVRIESVLIPPCVSPSFRLPASPCCTRNCPMLTQPC
jgi:hypothetical protein